MPAESVARSWDDRAAAGATLTDSWEFRIREYLRTADDPLLDEPDVAVIRQRLRLTRNAAGVEVPRNVAVLLFAENSAKWFPGARLVAGHFAEDDATEVWHARTFSGDLIDQLQDCLRHLQGYKVPDRLEAAKWFNVPPEAIREWAGDASTPPLRAVLEADHYVDEDSIRDAVRRCSSFNLVHFGTGLKIDVFAAADSEYESLVQARRVSVPIGVPGSSRCLWVASAEGMILAKLVWYRRGGETSERQWRDVQGMIEIRGADLDLEYLRRWAPVLGVADLLKRALPALEGR